MDREVKECVRLAEAAIDHIREQRGHSRYSIALLNKLRRELAVLEVALQTECEEEE